MLGLVACGAGPQPPEPAPVPTAPCAGTRLAAGPPQPHAPYASTFTWLDDKLLVIGVGATTYEVPDGDGGTGIGYDTADAAGLLVVDASSGAIVRAWHGVSVYSLVPRKSARGRSDEVLFAELEKPPHHARAGRIDVMTGCMVATPWRSETTFVLDADDDELIAEGDRFGSHAFEVLDASTLSSRASGKLPPGSFTEYDAASRSVVSIGTEGTIETRDPRTLAVRERRELGIELHAWSIRSGRGELVASYLSRCKRESRTSAGTAPRMPAPCVRGSLNRWGLVRLSLATLADVSRSVEDSDDELVELRRSSWKPSGAQAIVQCRRIGEELCSWDPDADAKTPLAPLPVAYTLSQLAWRDDDVFAAATESYEVIVRSLSRGTTLASVPLPRL